MGEGVSVPVTHLQPISVPSPPPRPPVVLGYFAPHRLQDNLYTLKPYLGEAEVWDWSVAEGGKGLEWVCGIGRSVVFVCQIRISTPLPSAARGMQ